MRPAAEALAPRTDAPLVAQTVPLPADVDPFGLWQACPETERFFWERPAAGEAIAAVGTAAVVRTAGADRFAAAARDIAALGLPPAAVLVGG
ncbi:MAG: hypothetical protein U0807_18400, partial [Candidatus Binatia bacterium]